MRNDKMWLACALLMTAAVSPTLAQTYSLCSCKHYFRCVKPTPEHGACKDLYDVCCGDEVPPEPQPVPGPQPEPEPATGGGVCGVRGKHDAFGRVVDWKIMDDSGDNDTFFGEFPWMVAVLKVGETGAPEFLGGGSFVYSNLILTAAHKVSGLSASNLSVKAGVWNSTDIHELDKHQDRTVSNIVLHPDYDMDEPQNNVALLVLDEPLEVTENVVPVCLPTGDTKFNKTDCIATGWGTNNFGKKNVETTLKKVILPLVDSISCQAEFREEPKLGSSFNLHNSFICAGRFGADTCTGDGGGPLVCPLLDDSGKYMQVGITAFGVGCGVRPGAYSSVVAAREWIETTADTFPPINVRQPPVRPL